MQQESLRGIEEFRRELSRIRSDLVGISSALKELRRRRGNGAAGGDGSRLSMDRFRHAWDDVRERGRRSVHSVRERGRHSVEAVGHKVEERPILTILAFFGTGLVLGSLLGLLPRKSRCEEEP